MKKKWSNKMRQSSSIKKIFALGAASLGALTIMGAANDVAAQSQTRDCRTTFLSANENLQTATCYTRPVFEEYQQRTGQFVLVNAIRPIPERPANIFTSNASGTLGYNVERDDLGDRDRQNDLFYVRIRYTGVLVNTNIQGNTPQWALIGDNSAHNQWLANTRSESNNRVILGATVLRSDGSRGGFMMVMRSGDAGMAGISNTGAITLSFNETGEIRPTVGLVDVNPVEPNYGAFVNASRQVASLNPSN